MKPHFIVIIILLCGVVLHASVHAGETVENARPEEENYRRYQLDIELNEYAGIEWNDHLVRQAVDFERAAHPDSLELRDPDGHVIPHQLVNPQFHRGRLRNTIIAFIASLRPLENAVYQLHYDTQPPPEADNEEREPREAARPAAIITPETAMRSVISTGSISLRVLTASGKPQRPLPAQFAPPPIEAVRGSDGNWRGAGNLLSPDQIISWSAEVAANGPVFAEVVIHYEMTHGRSYRMLVRAIAGADWIGVEENFRAGGGTSFILRNLSDPHDKVRAQVPSWGLAEIISRLPAYSEPGAAIDGMPARRMESISAKDSESVTVIFTAERGRWASPTGNEIIFANMNGNFIFHFPITIGSRRWGIHATTLDEGSSENINRVISRIDLPLNDVLRMRLSRDNTPLMRKNDTSPPQLRQAGELLRRIVELISDQGFSSTDVHNIRLSEIAEAARTFQQADAADQTDSSVGDIAYARLALLGYILSDESFYGSNFILRDRARSGFDFESVNWFRNIERAEALAEIAAALPEHPVAHRWRGTADRQIGLSLRYLVDENGAWLPGRPEHARVRETIRRTVQTLDRQGRSDLLANPAYRAMMNYGD